MGFGIVQVMVFVMLGNTVSRPVAGSGAADAYWYVECWIATSAGAVVA